MNRWRRATGGHRAGWWRRVVVVVVVAGTAAAGAGKAAADAPGGPGSDPAAESLLGLTLHAARSGGYAGTVSVTVNGQGGTRSGELRIVHADSGHLVIEAPDPPGPASGSLLVQAGQSRSVGRVPAGSINRGQTALADDVEPDSNLQQMLGKYRVLLEGGARVLQRGAEVVRIERIADQRLVERWTIGSQGLRPLSSWGSGYRGSSLSYISACIMRCHKCSRIGSGRFIITPQLTRHPTDSSSYLPRTVPRCRTSHGHRVW